MSDLISTHHFSMAMLKETKWHQIKIVHILTNSAWTCILFPAQCNKKRKFHRTPVNLDVKMHTFQQHTEDLAVVVKNLNNWFDANFSISDYVHKIHKTLFIQMCDPSWA